MPKSLYKLDANGAMQVWTIGGSLETSTVTIQYGQLNGAMQTQLDKVSTNNSGRGLKEQMVLEMSSRITRQKAKGYRTTMEEAIEFKNMNDLNMLKPMLAQRYDKMPKFNFDNCLRQFKYDGHRMLIHNNGDKIVAYSRNGKVIDTLDHILNHIDIPPGCTLDGEVYSHGVPLQTIASWCKRYQENTLNLEYVVYDTITNQSYKERLDFLENIPWVGPVRLAPTWEGSKPITHDLREAIDQGYEGLILRADNFAYEPGKRSKSLIKVKETLDDEFLVVDIDESRDGWAVLECMTKEGNFFRVSAPGTIEEKKAILENSHQYLGLMVRVEFFQYTKDRIPFHPVAISFRDKGGE